MPMGEAISRITSRDVALDRKPIGKIGNSGMSKGPHLHLEIIRGVVNSNGKQYSN